MQQQYTKRASSVSVIVPNLNQGQFLEQAIESILSQSNLDIKLAILDAGSTDNSIDIIKKYEKHISYWRSNPDSGQAAAINEGYMNLPETDYVCWLNADDGFLKDGLSKMAEILENNDHSAAVYAKAYITDYKNDIIDSYPTKEFSVRALSAGCIVCQPATLIRSSAWEQVNGVDEQLHMCMDYDLWWKIQNVGSMAYLKEFTAFSRDHDGTKTRNYKDKHYHEAFNLLKKHLGYVPWHWCVSYVKEFVLRNETFLGKIIQRFIALPLFLKHRF